MRHVVEIEPRTWLRIQELIREGRYESAAQFLAVAIQNQIQLEALSLERLDTEMSETQHQGLMPITQPTSTEVSLGSLRGEPFIIQPREERSDDVIWGLYNRIFPVKITVRVLGRLLIDKGAKSIELKTLREEASSQARVLGKQLLLTDRTRRSERGERLATGLPIRRSDKSLDRFKNMFVGAMSGPGRVNGFPAVLKFVTFQRLGGHVEVFLTATGFKFANLKNPILDDDVREAENTLSVAESDFFMTHIHRVLPREWELCQSIIASIPEGRDKPTAVDDIIRQSLPGLNPSMIAPTRAGVISRLDELGLVQRRQDGLQVSYALTQRGESFLRSAQGVATPR